MYALKKRIKDNDKYQVADDYSKKLENIARATNWYETKVKYDKANQLKLIEKTSEVELKNALEELKVQRNFRLKQLYMEEALQYEDELHKKGLAIFKDKY